MAAKKKVKEEARVKLDARKLIAQELERIVRAKVCGRGKQELLNLCIFATMGIKKDLMLLRSILIQHRVVTVSEFNAVRKRSRQQSCAA